jgi:hypothetical protein
VRSLDQSKKVRLAFYERLKSEDFDFERFRESDRLSVIKNGLQDPDEVV